MDELVHHSWQYYSLIHKKCHPRTYHSDNNYHTTLNIIFKVLMLFWVQNDMLDKKKSYYSNWLPTVIRQNSVIVRHAISTRQLANPS